MIPDVEVLLPVHDEAGTIEETIREIFAEISSRLNVGFIVCEDGSQDNSVEVLRRLARELPIRLNSSKERRGYSGAVREGMRMVTAQYLLCLDSDGQCDPKDFRQFWEAREQTEIAMGWRVRRADDTVRRLCSGFFHLFHRAVLGVRVHDPSCPFVLMRQRVAREMVDRLGEMREGFWWEFTGVAHGLGYSIAEFPVQHRPRAAGETQVYGWTKMPGIFLRHVAALWRIRRKTREGEREAGAAA